jgi:hypothetical protein
MARSGLTPTSRGPPWHPRRRCPDGLVLNAALRWWWADPAAGLHLIYYAAREIFGAQDEEPA